ncbi:MAG: MFS transporter [Mesorhizobium sp.]|uniref:MFS transporter n=1 Tax=unclassified Mesorhizobium TaxID=325217 RepID=UPI000FCA2A1F|nr:MULTISPECIES: MFS transporter [unclassified Mesorhizobium]RUV08179.1 MFS transporter [Mesorhizobium sp. M1A.F.Ca.IN.020.03.2.1]RUV44029.1 MFS transporter [Mesorhizobium sp. M1A.T.Ca.IN.004.03.1.1]RUV89216.1 MFS transporter [Mesorhizobium sp. M1A.F.Ca.IN.020.32.1.1]RUW06165.1 MFS transporter [Mesorhizobium sp. M1A.F.Ca.IN.022.05.2.1]RUW29809.1 MFS transporter [Mesorhizobium sp. M1A.F.Ca.IN.020.06.1.1]
MSSIRPLIPLLIAAGILLGGNGLQGTLIALRGAQEGFSASDIGLMGTFYFAGFLLGCLAVTRILKAVGHVRTFAALAAIASVGTLLLVLVIDPVMWCAVRFAGGFCFAGLFTVMEAWLNSGVGNKDRARVLAIYRMVDIGSVTGAQFLIPIFGAGGFAIFAVMSMMITFSLVPVSLGDRSNPAPPEDVKLDLPRVWRISPLGSIGCIAVGLTNSAFRTLSPVYAEEIGMSVADVVTFVSVGIFGGALIQYPLGYLSDRRDRRSVLLATTCCALLAALALAFVARADPFLNFIIVFIFGSFAMPLYSLSAAHANDRAGKGEFVLINAALMLFYSFGAIGGPIAASAVMQHFGPSALFVFNALVYAVLIIVILYRMQVRSSVPAGSRSRFTALLRTSTLFARLARRGGDSDKQD